MQVAHVVKGRQDADGRQPLGGFRGHEGRSSEGARLAVQQAVQQVGDKIWSWRVVRVGVDYKMVGRSPTRRILGASSGAEILA